MKNDLCVCFFPLSTYSPPLLPTSPLPPLFPFFSFFFFLFLSFLDFTLVPPPLWGLCSTFFDRCRELKHHKFLFFFLSFFFFSFIFFIPITLFLLTPFSIHFYLFILFIHYLYYYFYLFFFCLYIVAIEHFTRDQFK